MQRSYGVTCKSGCQHLGDSRMTFQSFLKSLPQRLSIFGHSLPSTKVSTSCCTFLCLGLSKKVC